MEKQNYIHVVYSHCIKKIILIRYGNRFLNVHVIHGVKFTNLESGKEKNHTFEQYFKYYVIQCFILLSKH